MKTKIYLPILALTLIYQASLGQTITTIMAKDTSVSVETKALIRTADNLKSGNWTDVSTNFFQLAFTDLSSSSRSFNFKTNLFALKVKADSTLLIDTKYIKHGFDRNFQFNISIKLDSSYHLSGFSTGFTWAIINKRDASVIKFREQYHQVFFKGIVKALEKFKGSPQCKNDSLYNKTRDTLNAMFYKNIFVVKDLPIEFQPFCTELQNDFNTANVQFTSTLAEVAMQPLFTVTANGVFDNKVDKFNSANGELVYLKGLNTNTDGSGWELDLRSKFTLTDTTLNTLNTYRNIINTTAGANFVFAKLHKSYFEIKPYFQYQNILSGLIANEKKEDFYFNAAIRFKVTDNLWIPLIVKYDIKNANFLGFLNLSLNLDAFSNPSKQ